MCYPELMKYAVSELKTHLTQALREVEQGKMIEVTRHGKSVAVLIAKNEYEDLTTVRPSFALCVHALRESSEFMPLDAADFDNLRDKDAGRAVNF